MDFFLLQTAIFLNTHTHEHTYVSAISTFDYFIQMYLLIVRAKNLLRESKVFYFEMITRESVCVFVRA